ncbi:hypothetical protein GC194_04415 [bacterium]|nr:hypothetical protein [bacterium]
MQKVNLLILFSVLWQSVLALDPIVVASLHIKVSGLTSEKLYYGFAKGDQVNVSLSVEDRKDLKEIEIYQYPDYSLFIDYETTNSTFTFTPVETGIYLIRLYNANVAKRVCQLSITRTPAHDSLSSFNPQVYWRTEHDSSFYTVQEKYLVEKKYITKSVQAPQYFYINSGSNSLFKGGSSRITIPVELPAGTVEWYYTFSADRDEQQIKKTTGGLNLVGELTSALDQTGSLGFALSMLTTPPGGNVCDIYLLDFNNSRMFEQKVDNNGGTFYYKTIGSRQNIKSGVVKITDLNSGIFYIGIKNPDRLYGINVTIEVAAVILEETWAVRDVKKVIVTSHEVPYLSH